jgi:hypothetical protein
MAKVRKYRVETKKTLLTTIWPKYHKQAISDPLAGV